MPTREPRLAAGDGNGLPPAHVLVAGKVLRHHRLLEPADVAIGDGATKRDRFEDP
jgi:hypothetical protein